MANKKRFTFFTDGYPAVTCESCYEDQSEYYTGPAIERLAEYEATGLMPEEVAQVRHGRWCWDGRFRACSKCGSYVEFTETLGASHRKYCPNCGAKMDGGESKEMKR